jgi:multidrug efflux pump subunit AcrB
MNLNLASSARPYFGAVMLTVALLTAGGIYSATRMPSGVYPEVTFPRIAVVARVPGMAVPNMEVQVTQPMEQAVSSVIGVAQVRSKTIRGGSELSVDFNPGTDMRRAEQLTWNRIGGIRSQLPPETELTVEQMTPSVFPIMSLVLTGGDSPAALRDYAFYQLAPLIKNIPDVLYANVAGGDLREIEVEVRPDDLLATGLSAADLADQIGKAHRLQPVGRIERPPFAFQIIVNTQGQTARDIEELVIAPKGNQPLLVRDVADVKVLHQDRVLSIGFGGKDAVVITIFRRLGGNTVNISRDVHELLKKPRPKNITAEVVYDQATFVRTAVDNVRDAIVVGGLFSILILLAFLHSWRATLVSALAIPTTLAITFVFLPYRLSFEGGSWEVTGESLNLMSLGGLAVAIGLIIDDTVVVIENIARHLAPQAHPGAQGPSVGLADPVDAASGEITGAVVGSTLTTVLVFVPLAFISGVYGQFFASLSWSLSIAVLVSMVISLTLVPVCAAKFLAGRPIPPPGRIYNFLADIYERILSVALHFPKLSLVLSLLAVLAGVILWEGIPPRDWPALDWRPPPEPGKPPPDQVFKSVETGLMPAMDEGAFVLDYWAPGGTPLERTEEMARKIEEVLSRNPDVDAYVRRAGAELGIFATQTNRGDFQIRLRPAEESLLDMLGPLNVFRKPLRPPWSDPTKDTDTEREMKKLGTELAKQKYGPKFTEEQMWAEGKEAIRQKYRRRPMKGTETNKGIMDEIEDEVKDSFHEHQLKIELVPIMQDELNDLSGANKPVELKIFGPDHNQLRKLATDIAEMLEKKGKGRGIKEPNTNFREGNPDLMIRVDGVQAGRFGLTPDLVERQLRAIYQGQIATQVRESALFNRITDVRVRYPDRYRFGTYRFDPDQVLEQLILLPPPDTKVPEPPTAPLSGVERAVPLFAVAKIERSRTPDAQWRENQQPAVFVSAEQNEAEAGLDSIVADIRRWMGEISMPANYRWELGGHYLKQQEAFKSLGIVMVVAIFLVFIMLAFQFRSVVLPLLIFMTQPLSLVSGLFALWITGTPLNVSSYMGAILLIGLDMKNGILLVEYIQQLRRDGMELRPALLLAGRTRFRPILMTSLAAILGLLPLAFGIGPGAQMQQPLAIMVIGGLTANMLFTRMIIPVGYLVLEGRRARPFLV